MPNHKNEALVVMSGGQDSATCLFWALDKFDTVKAISFDYGQRHAIELECAQELCALAGVELHEIFDLSVLGQLAASSAMIDVDAELTADGGHKNLPSSFVPGRNIIMLSLAAARAISDGVAHLVTGVCQTDYSGYPDCRRETIDALENVLRLGNDLDEDELTIHTPLMYLDKAQTWELADDLGVLDAIVLHTHTCYEGNHEDLHPWGYGCGECPSCLLRKRGYAQYKGIQ